MYKVLLRQSKRVTREEHTKIFVLIFVTKLESVRPIN